MQYSPNFSLKHELKAQDNDSQKIEKNSKIKNGVIFIDDHNNYERKEVRRTYWFHKYLQDLQSRGISKKL